MFVDLARPLVQQSWDSDFGLGMKDCSNFNEHSRAGTPPQVTF